MQNDGKIGEDIASEYLNSQHYKILKRNFRTRLGEIDIIAIDKKTLVFVEVKYGSDDAYLRVNQKKFEKISRTANAFIKIYGDFKSESYRIDVIAISKDGKINHFKDVAMDFS
jgi:putative endonuclease